MSAPAPASYVDTAIKGHNTTTGTEPEKKLSRKERKALEQQQKAAELAAKLEQHEAVKRNSETSSSTTPPRAEEAAKVEKVWVKKDGEPKTPAQSDDTSVEDEVVEEPTAVAPATIEPTAVAPTTIEPAAVAPTTTSDPSPIPERVVAYYNEIKRSYEGRKFSIENSTHELTKTKSVIVDIKKLLVDLQKPNLTEVELKELLEKLVYIVESSFQHNEQDYSLKEIKSPEITKDDRHVDKIKEYSTKREEELKALKAEVVQAERKLNEIKATRKLIKDKLLYAVGILSRDPEYVNQKTATHAKPVYAYFLIQIAYKELSKISTEKNIDSTNAFEKAVSEAKVVDKEISDAFFAFKTWIYENNEVRAKERCGEIRAAYEGIVHKARKMLAQIAQYKAQIHEIDGCYEKVNSVMNRLSIATFESFTTKKRQAIAENMLLNTARNQLSNDLQALQQHEIAILTSLNAFTSKHSEVNGEGAFFAGFTDKLPIWSDSCWVQANDQSDVQKAAQTSANPKSSDEILAELKVFFDAERTTLNERLEYFKVLADKANSNLASPIRKVNEVLEVLEREKISEAEWEEVFTRLLSIHNHGLQVQEVVYFQESRPVPTFVGLDQTSGEKVKLFIDQQVGELQTLRQEVEKKQNEFREIKRKKELLARHLLHAKGILKQDPEFVHAGTETFATRENAVLFLDIVRKELSKLTSSETEVVENKFERLNSEAIRVDTEINRQYNPYKTLSASANSKATAEEMLGKLKVLKDQAKVVLDHIPVALEIIQGLINSYPTAYSRTGLASNLTGYRIALGLHSQATYKDIEVNEQMVLKDAKKRLEDNTIALQKQKAAIEASLYSFETKIAELNG